MRRRRNRITINKVRTVLYTVAAILGDLNAVLKGRIIRRVGRRVAGRVTGNLFRRLFK